MTETRFVRFTEENETEGEYWNFWLQVNGNRAELELLRGMLARADEAVTWDLPYTLDDAKTVPESEVDTLVDHSGSGYMDYENKVTGVFICPNPDGDPDDFFYKGQIKRHFKAA
jgi:hypothetical protein